MSQILKKEMDYLFGQMGNFLILLLLFSRFYNGEWKNGKQHGKGIYKGFDGVER